MVVTLRLPLNPVHLALPTTTLQYPHLRVTPTVQTYLQIPVLPLCPGGPGTPTVTLSSGIHIYYSSGSITINCNIVYPTVIAGASQIPSFELVVKGNIYINTAVSKLAGTYIAETGTIYDTGSGVGSGGGVDICPLGTADDASNDSCSPDKLTVDGSFIANQIKFDRTFGDISAASTDVENGGSAHNHAAEEFDYSPLNWLIPTTTTNNQNIQSITSLPPIVGN